MKKVVDGKMYNTETAKEIHNWSNSYFPNDFNYCEETLYQTKKGAFFLYGEGGAMSSYAEACGSNCWHGGEGITPLTKKAALEWLENHDGSEVLESQFAGDIEEA